MIGPVVYRLRGELRARWRAWLGVAVLVGLAAGSVMALAAGARRTDTTYGRFLEAHLAYDVMVTNSPVTPSTADFDFVELAGLPMVADSARGRVEVLSLDAYHMVSADPRIGTELNRFKVIDGRLAAPDAIDEVVVGYGAAQALGVRVGDALEVMPDELVLLATVYDPEIGELVAEVAEMVRGALPDGVLHVVGVVAAPGEVPPHFRDDRPTIHHTEAFGRLFDEIPIDEVLLVRLHGGEADIGPFLAELEARSGGQQTQVTIHRDHATGVERSTGLQATGLWILAGLTGLAGLVILGQVLIRFGTLQTSDLPVLSALGFSHRQAWVLTTLRSAVIGIAGALVGIALAIPASTLFPTGLAAVLEPDPGAHVDLPVLALGALVTVGGVTMMGAAGSLLPVGRRRPAPVSEPQERGTGLGSTAGALPVSVGVGVRMAFDRGRGRDAVPTWTTFGIVTLGIATIAASVTFGASLRHLLVSPHLYGVTWDVELSTWQISEIEVAHLTPIVEDPSVRAVAVGAVSDAPFTGRLEIGGLRVDGVVIDPIKGDLTPPMLQGRAPRTDSELALGARTARALDLDLGALVPVRLAGLGDTTDMELVGIATLPVVSANAQLGAGGLLTRDGVDRLLPDGVETEPLQTAVLVGLAPGADLASTTAALSSALAREIGYEPVIRPPPTPSDIVDLGRIETLPLALGLLLAGISAATLVHLLRTAATRRRGDLAVLRALGFVRRQVRHAVVAWATTVVLVGVAIGLPLGVVIGRQAWSAVADGLGVPRSPVVPLPALALVAGVALAVAAVLAMPTARAAAGGRSAAALRAE